MNIKQLEKASGKIALLFIMLFVNTAIGEPSRSQLVIHSRVQHRSSKGCGIPNHPPSVLSPKFVGHTFVNKTMRIGRPAFRHTIRLDSRASSPRSLRPEKHSNRSCLLSVLSTTNNPRSTLSTGRYVKTAMERKVKPVQRSKMLENMVTVKPWWQREKK